MSRLTVKATKRSSVGKNENNRLRAKGFVPINVIYNGKSIPGSVDETEVNKVINSGIRSATLLDMEMEGEGKVAVFVKEIQRFPATNRVRHIDFYKVTPGKKITAKVGVKTTGVAKGSKAGGQFEHLIHELKIKSVPEDLKDLIVVDVTELGVGDSIKVSQLDVPKSWEIITNGDPIVTSVNVTKAILAAERSEKVAVDPKSKAGAKAAAKAPAAGAKAGAAPAAAAAKAPAAKKK
ncbi:MAG: 50S ribosomal protein L25/general stress protein Ctc [Leptospiraceae bacterium]|nr:50S ribosomal protein L25/general stress protein Ctc [Leptospiraceae bacterium]